ncbi:c-type cytochrome [Mangrovibrevibacter kandeliae]|uniref:c-type cytochrome n=1 Tax=Mangrovibrevibacter kandeliae TaxID=2968473 RepID=UPI0021192321|nr:MULTISPECIES: cytochrome c family protein [unclassified Aurantimonas]MCQ8780845.1 cytochrome c family protein [Aurantimonas sp. CSK15Z-1]MCW4113625.1 cytochrome c family protein [Aurantimonas sp. MSK8Z-1]
MRRTAPVIAAALLVASGVSVAAQTVGDADAGKKVFNKCRACHDIGPAAKNKIGPELNGIVGEKIASVENYSFSDDLKKWGDGKSWNEELLTTWLTNPKAVAPKTKMVFPGLKKPEEITNVIAYLASFDESGQPADPAAQLKAAAGQ